MSFFDRENTVAPAGYNRWLVPPAALAVHLSIGQVYAWGMVGSILGTFLAGFVLIDHLGCKGVLLVLGTGLAFAATVLGTVSASWKDVVRTTVYLHDMGDFPRVNEVYAKALGDARPARSTVQVSALPRGVLVEIDAIVAVP